MPRSDRPVVPVPVAVAVALALTLAAPLAAQVKRCHVVVGNPPKGMETIHRDLQDAEQLLLAGKAEKSLRRADRATAELLQYTWHDRRIAELLAEAALLRAVAEASLGRRDNAVWLWETALNLEPSVASREVSVYGDEAVALTEIALRPEGSAPAGVEVDDPFDPRIARPRVPSFSGPPLRNEGAHREPVAPVTVEVLVDADGRLRHPVVTSWTPHPVAAAYVLENLRDLRAEPARRAGEAVAVIYPVEVAFDRNRW